VQFEEVVPYDFNPLVMTLFVELVASVSLDLTLREQHGGILKITKGILTSYKRQVFLVRINGKRITDVHVEYINRRK
jgi:hypothetical protein